jgi:DNA replication protein DnaC
MLPLYTTNRTFDGVPSKKKIIPDTDTTSMKVFHSYLSNESFSGGHLARNLGTGEHLSDPPSHPLPPQFPTPTPYPEEGQVTTQHMTSHFQNIIQFLKGDGMAYDIAHTASHFVQLIALAKREENSRLDIFSGFCSGAAIIVGFAKYLPTNAIYNYVNDIFGFIPNVSPTEIWMGQFINDHMLEAKEINTVIRALFRAIIGVTSIFGGAKSIDKLAKNIVSTKTIMTSFEEASNYIFEEILNLPVNDDREVLDTLQKQLSRLTYFYKGTRQDFLLDSTFCPRMARCIDDTQKMLGSLRLSGKTNASAPFNSLKAQLTSMVTKSLDKFNEFKDSLQGRIRQEPICFMLAGPRAIGKTELSTYISHRIADHYGWDKHIYSLSVNEGFYEPYAGTPLGEYQDIFNVRKPDQFIKDFTKIFGINHYNFEGAMPPHKTQPCELKCVGMTTNVANYAHNLQPEFDVEGIEAIASRILRFEVRDPIVEAHPNPRAVQFHHRRPDYSHLEITQRDAEGNIQHFDVNQLINFLIEQIDARRLRYMARIADDLNPNAREDHMFIRLQGPPGTGKTHFATQFIERMNKVYRGSMGDKLPIVLVDDYDVHYQDLLQYVQYIQSFKKPTCFVLTSNQVYLQDRSTLSYLAKHVTGTELGKKFHVTLPHDSLMRRIGLFGVVKNQTTGNTITNDILNSTTVTFKNITEIDINGELSSITSLYENLAARFLEFRTRNKDVTIKANIYEGTRVNFDLTITSTTFDQLMRDCTRENVISTGLGRNITKLHPSKEFVHLMGLRYNLEDFFFNPESQIADIATLLITNATKIKYNFTMKIQLSATNIVFEDGVLYYPNYIPEQVVTTSFTDANIIIDTHVISHQEAVRFYIFGEIPRLPVLLQEPLHNYIGQLLETNQCEPLTQLYFSTLQRGISPVRVFYESVVCWIKDHPFLTFGATLLIAAGITTGIALKEPSIQQLMEEWRLSKRQDMQPNTRDGQNKQNKTMRKANQARRAIVRKMDRLDPYASKEQAERYREYEDQLRELSGGSYYMNSMTKDQWDIVQKLLIDCGESNILEKIRAKVQILPNMLRTTPLIDPRTIIDPLPEVLRKNYYIITTHRGISHALILKLNIGICVAHAFDAVGDIATITDDSGQYTVRCIDRQFNREIALFQVTTPGFLKTDITHHIATKEEIEQATTAYYMRLGATDMIASGILNYTPNRESTYIGGIPGPNLDTIEFINTAIADSGIIYGKGDCGFPLIIKTGDKTPKIAGIHHAYSPGYGMGKFSTIFHFKDYKPNSLDQPALNHYLRIKGPSHFENPPIDIIGSIPYFDAYMPPRTKKHYPSYKLQLENKCFDDFSPVNLEEIPPHIQDKLPKRIDGTPSILMKQAFKYGQKVKTHHHYHQECWQQAQALVNRAYLARYGHNKILSVTEALNHPRDETIRDFVRPFDRTTSAGPSYKFLFHLLDKKRLISDVGQSGKPYYTIDKSTPHGQYALAAHQQRYDDALQNIHHPMLVQDCKKVELLPQSKVSEGEARLFNVIDFDYNLLQKRIFAYHMALISKNRHKGFSQIGFNPYIEFHHNNQYMTSIKGTRRKTDYSRLDKTHEVAMIMAYHRCYAQITFDDNLTSEQITNLYEAMGRSYADRYHLCEDSIHHGTDGHVSGSWITGSFNCYAVEVATLYTMCRYMCDKHGHCDFPDDYYYDNLRELIYGDDKDSMFGGEFAEITFEQERDYNKELNYTLKDADKDESLTDGSFTSRAYITINNLTRGALKQSSINRYLYFKPSDRVRELVSIFDTGLLEAAMWGPKYYESFKRDLIKVINTHPTSQQIYAQLPIYTYKEMEKEIDEYIRFGVRDRLMPIRAQEFEENTLSIPSRRSKFLNHLFRLTQQFSSENPLFIRDQVIPNMDTQMINTPVQVAGSTEDQINPAIQMNIILTRYGKTTDLTTNAFFDHDVRRWRIDATLNLRQLNRYHEHNNEVKDNLFFSATANSTREAKYKILTQMLKYLDENYNFPPHLTIQEQKDKVLSDIMQSFPYEIKEDDGTFTAWDDTMFIDSAPDKLLLVSKVLSEKFLSTVENVQLSKRAEAYLTKILEQNGEIKAMSHGRYCLKQGDNYRMFSQSPEEVKSKFLDELLLLQYTKDMVFQPNMEAQAGSVTQNPLNAMAATAPMAPQYSSGTSQITSVIPTGDGAQPVGPPPVNPTPFDPAASTQVPESSMAMLNPFGPTNMLSVGAITFNLHDLIYTTPIASSNQLEFTDDMAINQILASIPYGLESDYLNPFIKTYGSLHRRYAGPFEYTFHIVGNATFSGQIIVGWLPYKPAGTTIDMSELQKYAWFTLNCNATQSGSIILKDARKDLFWREPGSSSEPIETRPHLVIASYITLLSPLRQGISVRVRVLSKCVNPADCAGVEPTMFADPIAIPATLDLIRTPPEPKTIATQFPTMPDLYMSTDGRRQLSWEISNSWGYIQKKRPLAYHGQELYKWMTMASAGTEVGGATSWTVYTRVGNNVYYYVIIPEMQSSTFELTPFPTAPNEESMQNFCLDPSGGQTVLVESTPIEQHTTKHNQNNIPGPVTLTHVYYQDWIGAHVTILRFQLPDQLTGVRDGIVTRSYIPQSALLTSQFVDSIGKQDYTYKPFLPVGWTKVNFSPDLPPVVSQAVAATNLETFTPYAPFYQYFEELAIAMKADTTHSIQFDLVDPANGRVLITLRYLTVPRTFVCNTEGLPLANYMFYGNAIQHLQINSIALVANATNLPIMNPGSFISRYEGSAFAKSRLTFDPVYKPNIWGALAGGVFSGVGQGLQQAQNHKYQKELQQAGFSHERDMFALGAQHQTAMQQAGFDHQMTMQQGMFTHQNFDREDRQQHDREMMTIDHNNRMAMRMGVSPMRMSNPQQSIRLANQSQFHGVNLQSKSTDFGESQA